jgi:nitrous oxidase accessory protein NosD
MCSVIIVAMTMLLRVFVPYGIIFVTVCVYSMLSGSTVNGMARPRVADRGDGLQIWRVAANILNKQSRTADSGWSSSPGGGRWANNPSP